MVRVLVLIFSTGLFWELLCAGLAICAAVVLGGLGPALAVAAVAAGLKAYERALS